MWRNILAMNWILLHRGTTSLCHKITQDYMYVNVKKCPSHEMDTFAPMVYFSVQQDYTRSHVCQCEKMSWPWNGYFCTEGLLLCATRLHEITCMSMSGALFADTHIGCWIHSSHYRKDILEQDWCKLRNEKDFLLNLSTSFFIFLSTKAF